MTLETHTLQLESWSIDRLIPYARNARTHSEAQVAQIAASIAEFGFNNPVLVDPEGGIIAGHGRVLAVRKLDYSAVPVIVLRHLTPNQKRAFRLADNKLALNAGWDGELLRLELEALAEQDFSLEMTGFDDQELTEVLAQEEQSGRIEADEAQAPQAQVITLPGEVWELGRHRLLCADATDPDNLVRVLEGLRRSPEVTHLRSQSCQ